MVKELTAGRVMVMEQDIPALKKMMPGAKKHPIDRVLHDGDDVKLGGSTDGASNCGPHERMHHLVDEGNRGWQQRGVEPRLRAGE
jgi:hypothetical protein